MNDELGISRTETFKKFGRMLRRQASPAAPIVGDLRGRIYEMEYLGPQPRIHGLGEEASWIVNSFQVHFGAGKDSRATYTMDSQLVRYYLSSCRLQFLRRKARRKVGTGRSARRGLRR